MTKIERAEPPPGLLIDCKELEPEQRAFIVTRDIVEDRLDWKKAFAECASRLKRLIDWNTVPQ